MKKKPKHISKKKTALITGATSGIGEQLAIDLSDTYQVIIAGRNRTKLSSMIKEHHGIIDSFELDITSSDSVHQCQVALQKNYPAIDLVILNAGTCEYVETDNFDSQVFKRVFDTNVFGTVNCIEVFLPFLRRSDDPHLSIMSSSATYFPFTRSEAYGASKAALDYLGQSLRVDLSKENIHVSVIHPGFVKTPLTSKNDFNMPMITSVELASKAIIKGIERQEYDIHFPKRFTRMLKILGALPESIQLKISRKMVKT